MPLKGYGTQEERIGIENLFQLTHELSHTWAISNICDKDENGQYNLDTMEAPRSFVLGETESKMIEHLLVGYLIERYPNYRQAVTDYARGRLIDSIHRDALDSYLKIGISRFERVQESTTEYLENDELDELALSLGFSETGNMMTKMDNYLDENGRFYQDDIKFRYLFGSIASLYTIRLSEEGESSVAIKMKKFFDMEKSEDIRGALIELGLEDIRTENLVSMYSDIAQEDMKFYEGVGKKYFAFEHESGISITPDEIEEVTNHRVRLPGFIQGTNALKEMVKENGREEKDEILH